VRVERSIPVRVISAANTPESWRKKAKRIKQARFNTRAYLNTIRERLTLPLMIQFHRTGPGKFDDDNLAYAFKGHRDAAAAWAGVDDGDKAKVRFTYTESKSGKHSFRIIITEKPEGSMKARFTRLDLDRMVEHLRKVPDEHLDSSVKQALEDLVLAQPEYDVSGRGDQQADNRAIPAVK
jgi:hypothetical protein